jgi:hypothetical protein
LRPSWFTWVGMAAGISLVTACGPRAEPTHPANTEYPCILHAPDTAGPDFSVNQRVEATKDGHSGAFDGVLQKVGNELVVVGLGPAGVRAFVLKQSGDRISFEKSFGPDLPFPPRNVLVDIHRAFFKRLPPPPSGAGTVKGPIDDEEVEEDWAGGNLVERRFARPGSAFKGVVRITYAPGCTLARCAPASFRLVNEWFGYRLNVTSTDYNWL